MEEFNFDLTIIPKDESTEMDLVEALHGKDERTMDEIFRSILPQSLYMNHYELHDTYNQFKAEEWRLYLKENDKFILRETAVLTEVNARKGLKNLASGDMKQGEATAIKQLLDRSEQINTQVKDKTAFVTVMLPDHKKDNEITTLKQNLDDKEQELEEVKKLANERMLAIYDKYKAAQTEIEELKGEIARLRGEKNELS